VLGFFRFLGERGREALLGRKNEKKPSSLSAHPGIEEDA